MARAYSTDLRKRVIEAVVNGASTRRVAAQFSIGISTVGSWYRAWQHEDRLEPGKQGQPSRSKLDEHEAFILSLIDTKDRDITLLEIVEELDRHKSLKSSAASVHRFFSKRGITFKKRQAMRQSRAALTF